MVILGAGLAGLSAAYHGNGIIYEKEKEIGGTCRSLHSQGYIFDLGIHVLHSKNKYVLNLLRKDKKLGLRDKQRSAWIHSYKTLTKYPFQANTFGLPKEIVKNCLLGFIDNNYRKRRLPEYANYEEWIYGAFGKGIAETFYLPYSEKFWGTKAKELTTDWLDIRVPLPKLEQVIDGALTEQKQEFGPNSLFQYPLYGGIQSIGRTLCGEKTRINFNKEADCIRLKERSVKFKDQSTTGYDRLISTIPLPELIEKLDDVPESIRECADDLKYNSVLCVNLGVKRENLTSAHWIYFPEDKFAAFRISFPKNFSRSTAPQKWSSIQAEISYRRNKPIKERDIVEKVVRDLIEAKIITAKDKIKLIGTSRVKYAYVIYDHNRPRNLKKINGFLRKHSIYTAGRYGRWEYLWMDEAILSGKDTVNEINHSAKKAVKA